MVGHKSERIGRGVNPRSHSRRNLWPPQAIKDNQKIRRINDDELSLVGRIFPFYLVWLNPEMHGRRSQIEEVVMYPRQPGRGKHLS